MSVDGGPCPLCGTPVAAGAPRCGACGLAADFGRGGAVMSDRDVRRLVGAFAAAYLVVLAAAALAGV